MVEIVRDPMMTRSLSLKNPDRKIEVTANVKQLTPSYNQITHKCQNGFVRGRNSLNNAVDMDTAGRLYSMFQEHTYKDRGTSCIPITPAFDFEAAFPYVIRMWIWLS